jgi:hypothetical protein
MSSLSKKKNTIKVILYIKRVVIEHIISCRLKKYKIMSNVFRNKLMRTNDRISDIVVGMVNDKTLKHQN